MSITVGQFRLTKTVGDMYVVHMEMFFTESILQDRASVFSGEVIEAMNTIGGVTRTKLAGRNKSNVDQ